MIAHLTGSDNGPQLLTDYQWGISADERLAWPKKIISTSSNIMSIEFISDALEGYRQFTFDYALKFSWS